ncbi:hypothetical protein AJ79_08654 [Helicocarpus griseus UAMH5409]|uniref:Uncharacterized protein n=1 Tax=Helicocarpus griseus UAMH5409 TaxID=1447875 RepID=A0A2B7WRF0_9EURO|nr:hypothetical protein AJ79_08654 [Helicocarpus griseus UAMH5409]
MSPSKGSVKKRQRSVEDHLPETASVSAGAYSKKKRKLSSGFDYTQDIRSARTFWGRLSKVWLTRSALDELDRRTPDLPSRLELSQPEGDLDYIKDPAQLRRFARHGGPDLGNLRGIEIESAKSLGDDTISVNAKDLSTKRSSAYDANFEQILIDHGAYPEEYGYSDDRSPSLPDNRDEILQRIGRPRPSLSPSRFSESDFQNFRRANAHALGEKKVMSSVFPTIRGNADIPYEEDKLFGNLAPFAEGIVDAKPDFYDGAQAEQLDHRVRTELSHYIVPSTHHNAPIIPNFFAEGKGPDGSTAVAKRQTLYDGVLGARAILQLQSYKKELTYDGNAYVVTSTYHDGNLKLYTAHPTPSADPRRCTDYHLTQLRSFALTDSPELFRQGASALRNTRDWAKEHRDRFIVAANTVAENTPIDMSLNASSQTPLSHSTHIIRESETSADELSAGITRMDLSVRKRPLSQSRRGRASGNRSKSRRRSRSDSSRRN